MIPLMYDGLKIIRHQLITLGFRLRDWYSTAMATDWYFKLFLLSFVQMSLWGYKGNAEWFSNVFEMRLWLVKHNYNWFMIRETIVLDGAISYHCHGMMDILVVTMLGPSVINTSTI